MKIRSQSIFQINNFALSDNVIEFDFRKKHVWG